MVLPLSSAVSSIPLYLGWFPSTGEWIIIAAFGLLLFGKRLPEVGRSLGKGIVEFKKGLKGVEEEVEQASNQPDRPAVDYKRESPAGTLPSGAKFDPYTGKPLGETSESSSDPAEPERAG